MEHIFTQFFYTLFKKAVKLACVATIDTTIALKGRGFVGLSKTATGTYALELDKKYTNTYGVSIILQRATAADFNFQVKTETVATDGKIVFFTLLDGVAADLTTGDKLFIELLFNDTNTL